MHQLRNLSEILLRILGLLVETILAEDNDYKGHLATIVEDDNDVLGRAILLLTISNPKSARIILDQLVQDCGHQETAKWLCFLLDAVEVRLLHLQH